jgi:hypothetical protein
MIPHDSARPTLAIDTRCDGVCVILVTEHAAGHDSATTL